MFEAWLAMQMATSGGLVSAPTDAQRYTLVCVHGAPAALQASLFEEWSTCVAAEAYYKLSQPDVSVTNKSDKDVQLPKVLELDRKVRDLDGLPPAPSRAQPAPARPAAPAGGGDDEGWQMRAVQAEQRAAKLQARAETAEARAEAAEARAQTAEARAEAAEARAQAAEAKMADGAKAESLPVAEERAVDAGVGGLSPEDAREMRAHFTTHDNNRSGFIEQRELLQLLRSLGAIGTADGGVSGADDEADELLAEMEMAEIDTNCDNRVSFKELCAWWARKGRGSVPACC